MNAAHKYDIIEYEDDAFYQDDISMLKSLCEISLSELMGEDHNIWLQKHPKFGFNLEIDNENSETIISEQGIHPGAIECFASFCRHFLNSYERFSRE